MAIVTILNNQSLFDIAVQTTGNAVNALEIAKANSLTPSDELVAGAELEIPSNLISDEDIFHYYKANGILPASALTTNNINDLVGCEGIGCWAIGIDFKVS